MAEAQKMMDDPEFQREMKKLTKSKEFQATVKKAQDMFNDPNTAAHAEARMEHMLRVGQEQLQKGAKLNLEQLLSELGSDPEAMQSMQKMLRDPAFVQQFNAMTKDNQFQTYVDAMKELMKDPAKKKYIESLGAQLKKTL
jgi:ABC-type dipeptide/oligopeptide/nickel transport system ATPase subunit